jgi:hypothetical protein
MQTMTVTPGSDTMRSPLEGHAWRARRRALVAHGDHSVALGIALRGLRGAATVLEIFAAVDEIVSQYLGAATYAILTPEGDVLVARGLPHAGSAVPVDAPLAWSSLGVGEWSLGWLAIWGLRSPAGELDAFDSELLAALASHVAAALRAAHARI